MPRRPLPFVCLALVLLAPAAAWPTTSAAPSFDELVAKAERILISEAVDVRPRWDESRGDRVILTDVTFKVLSTLKGSASAQILLQFLGGTVGDDTLEIVGMPRFRVGDRDLLFIAAGGHRMSPLVGLMHGRFRITTNPLSGEDEVAAYNGVPIGSIDQIGLAPPHHRTASRTMTLRGLELAVLSRLAPGREP